MKDRVPWLDSQLRKTACHRCRGSNERATSQNALFHGFCFYFNYLFLFLMLWSVENWKQSEPFVVVALRVGASARVVPWPWESASFGFGVWGVDLSAIRVFNRTSMGQELLNKRSWPPLRGIQFTLHTITCAEIPEWRHGKIQHFYWIYPTVDLTERGDLVRPSQNILFFHYCYLSHVRCRDECAINVCLEDEQRGTRVQKRQRILDLDFRT